MWFGKTCRISLALLTLLLFNNSTGQCQGYPCEESAAINKWEGNNFKVIVCSYGTPPFLFKKNCWRGNGLSFYVINPDGKRTLLRDHGEYYPEMDYSFENDALKFVIYTLQPQKGKLAFDHLPFFEEVVQFKGGKLQVKRKLMLQKPTQSSTEVSRVMFVLSLSKEKFKEKYPDDEMQGHILESSLYQLRNYGLIEPQVIINKLKSLESCWWNDGATGQALKDVHAELQIIKSILTGR